MGDNDFDISPLYKAKRIFDDFRQHLERNQDKAGAVQAFEYTYELSWKYMKKVLGKRGLETGSPKQTIRKAREEGLISDVESWFAFTEMRKITPHTYDEANMNQVLSVLDLFSVEVDALIVTLRTEKDVKHVTNL